MTTDKGFADELIAGNGYHPNCGAPAPDNPRCTRIVEYTNMGGKLAYGCTFEHEDNTKYLCESEFIVNPRVYWQFSRSNP